MNPWICNASPIILLGKLDRLAWLEILQPAFAIPNSVFSEIAAARPDDPARRWITTPLIRSHVVDDPKPLPAVMAWDLGAGETAVICRAISQAGSCALLDDRAARACAKAFNVPVIGTMGILLRAKQAGLASQIGPDLRRLQEVGSYLSPPLLAQALQLADEQP